MALFLNFGTVNAPTPVYPPIKETPYGPRYTEEFDQCPRPFVPSLAPEDLSLAEEIGILTPKSFRSDLDGQAAPFVPKAGTWSQLHISDPEGDHHRAHNELIGDIWLLEQSAAADAHEDMLDEAADWLSEQKTILWSGIGGPFCNIIADKVAIASAEAFSPATREMVKITKVFPGHSFASINGLACCYLPWGSETNRDGPPGVKQPLAFRSPLWEGEFVLADLEFHKQGRNCWRATSIVKKLPTEEMLLSVTEIEADYSEVECFTEGTKRKGFQYDFELPTNPVHIGAIIGKDGENINKLIRHIQDHRKNSWYGKMPTPYDHGVIDREFELPEVTIEPVDLANDYTPFIPEKTHIRVFLPVCAIWDEKEVIDLVSYFHS